MAVLQEGKEMKGRIPVQMYRKFGGIDESHKLWGEVASDDQVELAIFQSLN